MSEELLPCPFCNSAVEFEHSYREDDDRYPRDFWHVRIICCFADTGWHRYGNQEQYKFNCHVREEAEKELTTAWNARPTSPALAEKDAVIERLRVANGILEDALQEAGDDYPGSSMQQWCVQQIARARQPLADLDGAR